MKTAEMEGSTRGSSMGAKSEGCIGTRTDEADGLQLPLLLLLRFHRYTLHTALINAARL
jgi:hypothetical protein